VEGPEGTAAGVARGAHWAYHTVSSDVVDDLEASGGRKGLTIAC